MKKNYSYIINEYIEFQLKIHCDIYKLNFFDAKKDFLEKNLSNHFVNEFINIYDEENLKIYEKILNLFFQTINHNLKNLKRDEKIFLELIEIFNNSSAFNLFLDWFLSFSVLNGLLYEKFNSDRNLEINNIEVVDLINYIYNDLMLFVDFLYVHNFSLKKKNNFNEKSIKKLLFRIIIELKKKNILILKKITVTKEFSKNKNFLRYANMVQFENYTKPKSLFYLFKISNVPAEIKKKDNIILIGFKHYSLNTYLISTKINKEGTLINEKFINTIQNTAKTAFYIDTEMTEIVFNRLNTISVSAVDDILNNLKKKHFNKLNELEKINNIEDDLENLNFIKYQIRKKQKELSISIDKWIFTQFFNKYKNYSKPIYFIPYVDFRGRIYYKSLCSPQSNWMFRFIYNFGKYDIIENNNFDILKLSNNIKKKLRDNDIKDNLNMYAWIFLSIGFKLKNKTNLDKINIDLFITDGVDYFNKYKDNYIILFDELDNMDAIETIYYITLITNLKKKNYIKRYIIKDTTASVYQHLGKILLFKNKKSLKYTNLTGGRFWYDTYNPLIKLIKKTLDKDCKDYFFRKSLKPIFITTKYNVGKKKALEYYLDEINFIKDKNIFKKILKNFFNVYLNLIKGRYEEQILFKMTLEEFNEKILKYEYIEYEDIKINLKYYQMESREINIFSEKKRYTMAHYEVCKNLDIEQMQRAALPNIIHGLDALYARRIINSLSEFEIPIFTIHDSFAVSYTNIDFLIISAWGNIKIDEKFNFIEKSNDKIKVNSITILI